MIMDESNDKQANEWIAKLQLKAHPEGGFYTETYRSHDQCTLDRFNRQSRSCSTAIYYLLKSPESPRSHFHRIKADELWHFYKGSPLIIHVLDEEDSSHTEHILDNELLINTDGRPQLVIPAGKWFAAEIFPSDKKESYTLCGCTCAPGFDFDDFQFATRSYLIEKFPNLKDLVTRLTLTE